VSAHDRVSPHDIGRSLTHRIRNLAVERGVDPQRIRRLLVFQRMLARLARSEGWVVKGGFCLEVRLHLAGRATKDLDLALTVPGELSVTDVQDLLDEALEIDADQDGFTFRVERPVPISADDLGNGGWRATVRAFLGGSEFQTAKVDIVARSEEIADGTEVLFIDPPLAGAGFAQVQMPAVDVAQHAAEKLHAYCRIYAHERPSSRVKDLVDLVLLEEAELVDSVALAGRIHHVFAVRDGGAAPPAALPVPPVSWEIPYAGLAAELAIAASDVHTAYQLVSDLYARAVHAATTTERKP
jgi:hypothetical protein